MDTEETLDLYSVRVPVFEGPLDLLLHLIRENKIDIYDIPIADITHQYLEYLEIMKELNLEIAGEFLVMAATLIYIKSRLLLPRDEEAQTEEGEDPRLELVQRLLEYQALKEAALSLKDREETWRDYFWRDPLPEDEDSGDSGEQELLLFDLNLFDLIGAFRQYLDRAPVASMEITREVLTVKDKISYVLDRLSTETTVRFEDLFSGDRTRMQMVITFVALLEIIRLGLARAYQEGEFGIIWVINPEAQKQEEATGPSGSPSGETESTEVLQDEKPDEVYENDAAEWDDVSASLEEERSELDVDEDDRDALHEGDNEAEGVEDDLSSLDAAETGERVEGDELDRLQENY